jgi:predicted transcriptional regulator
VGEKPFLCALLKKRFIIYKVTIRKIIEILKANVVANDDAIDSIDIIGACSADLMSEVLYHGVPNSLLITSLVKPQVVRTAEIAGIKSIVFTQNKKPDRETIELAERKKIPLLVTPYSMYTASGMLFQAGLDCIQEKEKWL